MVRSGANAAVSVERFFELSILGLVASGFLAVAGSGYLDTATLAAVVPPGFLANPGRHTVNVPICSAPSRRRALPWLV